MLTEGILTSAERNRFLELVSRLPELSPEEIQQLNVEVPEGYLVKTQQKGIFG
jgi:2-methylcitrate dehydratase